MAYDLYINLYRIWYLFLKLVFFSKKYFSFSPRGTYYTRDIKASLASALSLFIGERIQANLKGLINKNKHIHQRLTSLIVNVSGIGNISPILKTKMHFFDLLRILFTFQIQKLFKVISGPNQEYYPGPS